MTWAEDKAYRAALAETARTHFHACGGNLSVCYLEDNWHLRCAQCGVISAKESLLRHRSWSSLYREGAALPLSIGNKIERIIGGKYMDSKALMQTTEQGMMARIERAKFPQALNIEEKRTLAMAAITYGFDPLMGELTIYQGRPYVSIDGRYRKARETGKLDGVKTRPATKEERDSWSIPADDFFFKAEVFVKGCSMPFEGWGRVRAAETGGGKGFKPVETNPQRMAEKRAETQALRKAFSIPLPSAEDIGLEDAPLFTEVDQKTGEVVETTAREVPVEEPEMPNPMPEPEKVPPAANYAAIVPKSYDSLIARAKDERGLTQNQVLALAKASTPTDVKDLAAVWKKVCEQPIQKGGK